jgi:hypothetical protein
LSDYLLMEIKEIAGRPTLAELRDRLYSRKAVTISLDTARLVREEREAVIVLDASAAIDWLLQTAAGQRIEKQFTRAANLFMLRTFWTLRLRRSCGDSPGKKRFQSRAPIRRSTICSIFV